MLHIGLDLGSVKSQICVREASGKIVEEQIQPTSCLQEFFGLVPKGSRVVLETCAESATVALWAIDAGHDVRMVPATLSRALGVGDRGIKTDRRDAQALSLASCRVDLRSVHIRSRASRQLQAVLKMREALVSARTQLVNTVRGWLRTQVKSVGSGRAEHFTNRFRRKYPESETPACVLRQLIAIDGLTEQIKAATGDVEKAAQQDAICVLLMTIPGVGPITALTYRIVIDDVSRFPNAHAVESYLGLTPGEDSSSFRKRRTGITKAGSADVRRSLIQGCWALRRTQRGSGLAQWAEKIAQRRGKNIATVALARKVAGIMYAMWRDNREFDHRSTNRNTQRLAA